MRLGAIIATVGALGAGLALGAHGAGRPCSSPRPSEPHHIVEVTPSTSTTGRLYAATEDGNLYVTDGGSWRKLSTRLPGWSVVSLGRKSDLLLSGYSPGLFLSRNGGGSWSPVACGWIVTDIAGTPDDTRTIYVGTTPPEGGGSGGGLERTTDGGRTWTHITAIPRIDPYDLSVNVVAVEPGSARHVYVGMESGGIATSTDGGDHWRLGKIDPRASSFDLPQLTSLSFGPGQMLWAGTRLKGVFRTDSAGTSWVQRGLHSAFVDSVVADQRLPNVVYAVVESRVALRRTVDGGAHWQPIPGLPGTANGIVVQPRDDSVYAWSATTVYRSRDHGSTWKKLPPLPA